MKIRQFMECYFSEKTYFEDMWEAEVGVIYPIFECLPGIGFRFESGIGVGIHGELPLGKYRLMKLSGDLKHLVDEPVELVANQYEPNLCRTQVWLQATPELAKQLLTRPLANHHLLIKA